MDNTLKIVYDTIIEQNVIKKNTCVIAALSGGADSVCLLMMLSELQHDIGFELTAVHINHMIRGEESDRDEGFCRRLCEENDIALRVFHEDVPKAAASLGRSLEETAREIRYQRFREAAGENGIITTAHTLSDNAETVLLNLIRGTGLKGLCGIPQVRDNISRPLINITREQVEEYLESRGQAYVTDSTNLSDDYTRNKIRHLIIPQMKEINGGFYKSFSNSLKALRMENSFIEDKTSAALSEGKKEEGIDISCMEPVVMRRAVSRFLSDNHLPVSFDNIRRICSLRDKDGRINIKKDTYIRGTNGVIFKEKNTPPSGNVEQRLLIGDNSIFDGRLLKAEMQSRMTADPHCCIDADKIQGELILRNRRFGDKVKLMGRDFTSSVKKLINEKIPPEKRSSLHFIADDLGIVFMEGFGIADRVKTDENTKRYLNISIDSKGEK